jgi:hypothetical protein
MATDENQAALAGATITQQPTDGALFEAAMLEHLATARARLDLMQSSCRIAWEYFMFTTMACRATIVVQQKLALLSSHLLPKALSHGFGACAGMVAIALLAVLLHLFNVLCVRRVWTRDPLVERVAASAADLKVVREFLEASLGWMMIYNFMRS